MFVKDPCGVVCIIITYVAVFYADYVVMWWVVVHTMLDSLWGAFHVVVFNGIILMLMMSHMKAIFSDPGIVPLPQSKMDFSDIHTSSSGNDECSDERDDWTVCNRCETYRPPRAHHCRVCQRCIRKMDHHCPWINNCVGERNQKYFMQFLVYVGTLAIYAIALVIISWVNECPQCSEEITIKQSRILHCVILVLESTLFGMFVIAILIYQFQAILDDETPVERLQGGYHHKSNSHAFTLLSQVCGKSHPLLWLVPCYNPPRYYYRRDDFLIHHNV